MPQIPSNEISSLCLATWSPASQNCRPLALWQRKDRLQRISNLTRQLLAILIRTNEDLVDIPTKEGNNRRNLKIPSERPRKSWPCWCLQSSEVIELPLVNKQSLRLQAVRALMKFQLLPSMANAATLVLYLANSPSNWTNQAKFKIAIRCGLTRLLIKSIRLT